ncbi:MAG: DUF6485 family protein [Candidatus Marinimicrobia bacterium]|nr:DUF6485 family protein [Candidatus Neomarinimicrobiota bacterium]
MECKKDENLLNCTCTYDCSHKGICCECVEYHRRLREIPGCFFSVESERTYNRSYDYFAQLVNKGKI